MVWCGGGGAMREIDMGIWQGVARDSLKYHLGPPCPTFLYPVGRTPLKQPYGITALQPYGLTTLQPYGFTALGSYNFTALRLYGLTAVSGVARPQPSFTPLDTPRRMPMVTRQ
jgi:hypothetical protein